MRMLVAFASYPVARSGCRRRSSAPAVGVEAQGLSQRHQLLAGGLRLGLVPWRVPARRCGAAPFRRGARPGGVQFPRVVVDRMPDGKLGPPRGGLRPQVVPLRGQPPLRRRAARLKAAAGDAPLPASASPVPRHRNSERRSTSPGRNAVEVLRRPLDPHHLHRARPSETAPCPHQDVRHDPGRADLPDQCRPVPAPAQPPPVRGRRRQQAHNGKARAKMSCLSTSAQRLMPVPGQRRPGTGTSPARPSK
jgi:hypothetical protein